jgi:hypothetical protein
MADEIETDETEESSESIWAKLGVTDPDEKFEAEEEEAEEEAVKEDKVAKKMTSRMDDLEKKYNQGTIKSTTDKFLAEATDLEKELFEVAAGEVKGDPERLIHVIKLAKENAAKAQERIDAAEKEQVKRAWGGAAPGSSSSTSNPDEEEVLRQKMLHGGPESSKAALKLWLKDSAMSKFVES